MAEEPIILGQRYGYGMAGGRGYNYVTGGGGKLINRLAVEGLVALEDGCACPAADTPEDMYIFGACAKRAGIQITHSNRYTNFLLSVVYYYFINIKINPNYKNICID